jgi:hypothetical protein
MTDIVERLRKVSSADPLEWRSDAIDRYMREAADTIERQAAEIARLHAELEKLQDSVALRRERE